MPSHCSTKSEEDDQPVPNASKHNRAAPAVTSPTAVSARSSEKKRGDGACRVEAPDGVMSGPGLATSQCNPHRQGPAGDGMGWAFGTMTRSLGMAPPEVARRRSRFGPNSVSAPKIQA